MNRWDVLRVFRGDLLPPHDKFCICLCPERNWFFYINSNPPSFRKKREAALEVASWEALFLTHISYIDVSSVITDLPSHNLEQALTFEERKLGQLSPSLIAKIVEAVSGTDALSQSVKDYILK